MSSITTKNNFETRFLEKGMEPKFTRVDLEYELRADADGMPVFRKCFEHEILLSFYDDDGARAFEEWWFLIGAESLAKYCRETDGYEHLID